MVYYKSQSSSFNQLVDVNHRFLLVWGGSYILLKARIAMPFSDNSKQVLELYTALISDRYEEPIHDSFQIWLQLHVF